MSIFAKLADILHAIPNGSTSAETWRSDIDGIGTVVYSRDATC